MKFNLTILRVQDQFRAGAEEVRVEKEVAKAILLENTKVVINGKPKYMSIRDIGLGICSIVLNEFSSTRFIVD